MTLEVSPEDLAVEADISVQWLYQKLADSNFSCPYRWQYCVGERPGIGDHLLEGSLESSYEWSMMELE